MKDKFDQNLEIALGHNANVARKEKALDTITNEIQTKNKSRAEINKAASKIKAYAKRNENKPKIDAMKSLLTERIEAKQKIGAAMKAKKAQQKYINVTTPLTVSTEPPRPSTQPMIDILSDKVSKNVVKKSMDKIIRKQAETAAATNIQKVVRGVKVRKRLPEIMEEADRQAIIKKKKSS